MTANSSANTLTSLLSALSNSMRSTYRLIGRVALGGLAIIAAGTVAMAMAFLGLLIALAAVILRFTRGAGPSVKNRTGRRATDTADGGVILEARKTGQGWTVE